jgi:hypothetical protein
VQRAAQHPQDIPPTVELRRGPDDAANQDIERSNLLPARFDNPLTIGQ